MTLPMSIADQFYAELLNSLGTASGTAWIAGDERADYPRLFEAVRRIAFRLRGVRNRTIVVHAEKSLAAYAAVFGVLLSGNTWIPLSPAVPSARAAAILRMTGAALLLTDRAPPPEVAAAAAEMGAEMSLLAEFAWDGEAPDLILPAFDDADIAYVMFTSGSTGTPKGVPMTHANYIAFVRNALALLPLGPDDVFSDFHDWAFDISIFYLFCAPMVGAALAPSIGAADRIAPLRYIQEAGLTVWSSVPSAIARIRQMHPGEQPATRLKVMFLCGEPFGLGVLDYCLNHLRAPHIYNFYGLTETGVENFWHPCAASDLVDFEPWGFVPIGTPLPGNEVAIGDDKELLLAGVQLTPGYLGEVGADRFIMQDGTRWFRTGDVVEVHLGQWFCKGRMDSQVKLAGYRIELMDIEVNIKRVAPVEEVICFLTERGGHPQLMAALLPRPGGALDIPAIKRRLAELLPLYMIPARMEVAEQMPQNTNGKIDRRQVRERYGQD